MMGICQVQVRTLQTSPVNWALAEEGQSDLRAMIIFCPGEVLIIEGVLDRSEGTLPVDG